MKIDFLNHQHDSQQYHLNRHDFYYMDYNEVQHFLIHQGKIVDLAGSEKDLPSCASSEILRNMRNGKSGWQENVPPQVAQLIQRRRLFGYQAGKR